MPSGDLAFRRRGHGPGLLYLHDAGADTLSSPAFDDLATDHDVVLLDLPGYGASRPPAGLTSVADMATLLHDFLDALDWPTAVVAGTSLGGWFAMELAMAYPQRVSGLLLADAAGLHCPVDFLFDLFAQGRAATSAQDLIAQAIWDRLPPEEGAWDNGPVGAAVWGPWFQELAAAAWASWHPYTADPRLLARLERITCPTHIVWGQRDPLIPLRHALLLAEGIPGATWEVVADAGHLLCQDTPDIFAAGVRRVSHP